jgi:hypothetical protein
MSEENKPMEDWLAEYSKDTTRKNNERFFKKFLEWSKKTPKELAEEFNQKDARHMILEYQNYLKNELGWEQNSIHAYVSSVRAFYTSQCESVKGLKRKIIDVAMAKNQHTFSLADLKAMYSMGDLEAKTVLSVGCSLGWEASQILNMDRKYFESLIKRARSQNEDFIAFDWQRPKTNEKQYGILSPLALENLEKFLKATEENHSEIIFDFNEGTLNNVIKGLVKESGIVTTGSVSWHLIRKWLMQALSTAGLNSYEVNIIIGKSIELSNATYLQTLKRDSYEKYKKIYPMNLSLNGESSARLKSDRITEALKLLFFAMREEGIFDKLSMVRLKEIESLLGITITPENKEKDQ